MTTSHFIIDVDFSYQHEDLPAIASHNIHIELRPGLDGLAVREAIWQFIEENFGTECPNPDVCGCKSQLGRKCTCWDDQPWAPHCNDCQQPASTQGQ